MCVRISMSAILKAIAWLLPIGAPNACALLGVADGLVDAGLRQPDRERGDRDAALVEDRQEVGVAAAALAQQVARSGTRQSSKDSSRVSEACQPTFEYFGATVRPARGIGTRIEEISLRPSSPRR